MKPKEPLLAVLLSLGLPALGQYYAGNSQRALRLIGIYLGMLAAGLAMIGYVLAPDTSITFTFAVVFIVLNIIAIGFAIFIIVDAYFEAKRFNQNNNLERRLSRGKKALLIAGMIFLLFVPPVEFIFKIFTGYVRDNVIGAYTMPAGSMSPTLLVGDRILADKAIYKRSKPQRGDLIVFKYPQDPSRNFVKRLIAFDGETVEIKDGGVYVNGQPLPAPNPGRYYENRGTYPPEGKSVTVTEGHYYVLGDNSAASHDSRYWGFLPEENVLGKIYKIYWPLERAGRIKN